jgi:hypothetical protein
MWHITLTFAGPRVEAQTVRDALERLADDHPFLLAGRYAADRLEVQYWDEARDAYDAAALALRLWAGGCRRPALLARAAARARALPWSP